MKNIIIFLCFCSCFFYSRNLSAQIFNVDKITAELTGFLATSPKNKVLRTPMGKSSLEMNCTLGFNLGTNFIYSLSRRVELFGGLGVGLQSYGYRFLLPNHELEFEWRDLNEKFTFFDILHGNLSAGCNFKLVDNLKNSLFLSGSLDTYIFRQGNSYLDYGLTYDNNNPARIVLISNVSIGGNHLFQLGYTSSINYIFQFDANLSLIFNVKYRTTFNDILSGEYAIFTKDEEIRGLITNNLSGLGLSVGIVQNFQK